jgi:circadian clock protein KaiC
MGVSKTQAAGALGKTGRQRAAAALTGPPTLAKCPTGIRGLDEVAMGGLPLGRPTLVCGGSGTGKTLLAMQFLVRGIEQHGEPGVFMCFEEREKDLAQNVVSLGIDLPALIAGGKLVIDHVAIDRSEITDTGDYNLDGLFIRLGAAIDAVGAKRVVLDTIETLFSALSDTAILRSELYRLFEWLKEKGVTAIVTGERGDRTLTRHGIEEYVSDCVILLEQKVADEVATRRLRIFKYRGSPHGTNEYPFLIDERGFTVLPITTIGLNYPASRELVSTGIPKLDAMLGGGGYFHGSTLLVSGMAGTGKTSIASQFADAACGRGERCIYFGFEESPDQIVRNMGSIGIDLGRWLANDLLRFSCSRPTSLGLEVHLSAIINLIDKTQPQIVVLDPVSSFESAGTWHSARAMLMRMVDLLKTRQITAMFTSLTGGGHPAEQSEAGISSLIDSWLVLHNLERAGERTRTLSIVKSRGRNHSKQARELLLSNRGIDLVDVFVGPDGQILTGSARAAQEMADRSAAATMQQDIARKRAIMAHKRKAMEARIADMQAELAAEAEGFDLMIAEQESTASGMSASRIALARNREGEGGALISTTNGGSR